MKGTRALSFLLALALLASLVIPGSFVLPAKADDTDSGMSISKKAKDNGDGTYTITLEAYATGEKVISSVAKDIPTDIILVLDQSGSMATKDFPSVGATTYEAYTDTKNSNLYSKRHNNNGNNGNLYYKLEDNSYVTVSVTRTQGESIDVYEECPSEWYNSQIWDYSTSLYVKNEAGGYDKVIATREQRNSILGSYYVYTYEFPNGNTVISYTDYDRPGSNDFDGNGPVYYCRETYEYIYTYTYTDAEGNPITIGTSTGENNNFTDKTLYYKTDTNGDDISRLQALKNAVTGFKDSVAQKAAGKDGILGTEDDIGHRIAVVGFAARENTNPGDYVNTEVFIGATQYKYGSAAKGQYGNAFQDMKTPEGQSNVAASIGALDAHGGTHIDLGMEMAKGILDSSPVPSGEKHNRVVIVFTDGSPGSGDWSSNDMTYADNAISYANQLRASGVNVYTVGIFNGADATSQGNRNGNDTQKANWFMQNLSDNKGTPRTPSYYLSAANSSTLNNIFKQISNQIESGGTSATLTEEAVIRDIIAPQFQLSEGSTAANITLETYNYTGENQWTPNNSDMGAEASIDENGNVVVTNFNFSEHWCGTVTNSEGTSYRGSKLVISFTVTPKEGFLGGNDVYTNGEASGIYPNSTESTPLDTFERPTVNVPIVTPEFTVNDKTIYEGNSTAASGLCELTDYTTEENAWKAAYVQISTSNTVEGDTVSPEDCTDYTVTVTYRPISNGAASEAAGGGAANAPDGKSESKTATVHVLHPVVTAAVNDVQKYYGESYTLGNDAGGSITLNWADGVADHTNIPTVEGTAPYTETAFHLEYAAAQFGGTVPKNDFDVTVTVKKGTDVVTGATITTTCNIGGSNCATSATDGVYTVHVKTCTLTINKTGGADGEPYVFDVYKNGTKYSEVSIVGNSTATIVELPVGSYTIVEDQGWSWRYSGDNGSAAVLSAGSPSGTITCTNGLNKEYWLNGFSTVVANIFGTPKN